MEVFIVFIAFFAATILSSMSGAGTTIITLPILISLGVNLPTAIAINQIAGAFWVLPAAYNYLKGRKIDWVFLLVFTVLGFIGVFVGVSVNIHVPQRYLEMVMGTIILCLVLYSYFHKELGLKEVGKNFSPLRKIAVYPFSVILGFYESFFGSGNGILFTITTFYTKGFDFIDALGHYYVVAFFWVIFSAFLYARNGYFNVQLTIPAVIGGMMGGFIGSRLGKYKGNKTIKLIFVIAGSILGLKLLLGL